LHAAGTHSPAVPAVSAATANCSMCSNGRYRSPSSVAPSSSPGSSGSQGRVHNARHVTGCCHLTQETRVSNAEDDVAGIIHSGVSLEDDVAGIINSGVSLEDDVAGIIQ
jgi:hypothetical protein